MAGQAAGGDGSCQFRSGIAVRLVAFAHAFADIAPFRIGVAAGRRADTIRWLKLRPPDTGGAPVADSAPDLSMFRSTLAADTDAANRSAIMAIAGARNMFIPDCIGSFPCFTRLV